jgi:hypothetical protein
MPESTCKASLIGLQIVWNGVHARHAVTIPIDHSYDIYMVIDHPRSCSCVRAPLMIIIISLLAACVCSS